MPVQSTQLTEPRIALCAIGKPDSESIDEWIRHHVELGVDHIYIYDDGKSSDILNNVNEQRLQYASVETIAKVFDYESTYKQIAYADCFRRHRDNYDWIVYLNIDQYITIPGQQSLKDILADERFQEFDVVRLNQILFSNYKRLAMDFNLPIQSDFEEKETYTIARSIVNCKAVGFYFTDHTIQRNGTPTRQCLPNLQEIPQSDATVNAVDLSVAYVTSNMIEMQWIQWKRDRGWW